MNREIKFRAWLHDDNFMYYDDSSSIFKYDEGNIEIMQYTGAKDINKKRIYEGDIVKTSDNHLCKVLFGTRTHGFGYNYRKDERHNKLLKFYRLNSKLEVIGNIFENPELTYDK